MKDKISTKFHSETYDKLHSCWIDEIEPNTQFKRGDHVCITFRSGAPNTAHLLSDYESWCAARKWKPFSNHEYGIVIDKDTIMIFKYPYVLTRLWDFHDRANWGMVDDLTL